MKKIILISILISVAKFGLAQDIHFSQFQETPLQLNPSFAGGFSGDQRVILNYRNQWASMGSPFTTYDISFDTKIRTKSKKSYLGLGFFIFKDNAGDLNMGTLQANLNIAGHVAINDNQTISAGIMGGFVQRSINASSAQWGSQFNGTVFDNSLPQGSYNFQNFSYVDLSGGLSWFYVRNASTLSSNDNLWARVGISVSHFTNPKQSFYTNQIDRVGMKPLFFTQMHIGLTNTNLALRPQLMWAQEVKQSELTIGTLFRYTLSESSKYTKLKNNSAISLGILYRVNDAFIPVLNFEYQSFSLGVSYDYNVSKLSAGTNGSGGFEISLKFVNPNPFGGARSTARFR